MNKGNNRLGFNKLLQRTQGTMKMLTSFLLLVCIYSSSFSQERQFKDDFDFLTFTIKDTYAGYQDKVKASEFDALVKKVKQSRSKDTFALLSQLTAFFHDHHVLLYDDGISKQQIDTQQCKKR